MLIAVAAIVWLVWPSDRPPSGGGRRDPRRRRAGRRPEGPDRRLLLRPRRRRQGSGRAARPRVRREQEQRPRPGRAARGAGLRRADLVGAGFGRSTGEIALNSPDYEVKDVKQLIDWLAEKPDVLLDAAGDPRVGMARRLLRRRHRA